ncbi:MAG: twin-arginine translocase TatA/TatE family subunit [Rhodanobacteraceae bacterium]
MDIFSPLHLLAFLVIVVVIFGTSKLTKIGPDLGKAMRGFKKAFHGDDEDDEAKPAKAGEKLQADPPAAASAAHQEQRDSTESKHASN